MSEYEKRQEAIRRYLANEKPSHIYISLKRSKSWFYKWLKRYQQSGEEGLKDQPKTPKHSPNKTDPEIENQVVNIRKRLSSNDTKETFYAPNGADSILWELRKLGIKEEKLPSISTVNRIIKRNNLLKSKDILRKKTVLPYPAPKANKPNDVHQFDTVGPRYINGTKGIERFYSLNLADYYSKVIVMKQYENTRNNTIIDYLINNVWNTIGIPKVLQVDNMLSIKGSNRHPRSLGVVIRLCLLLGIEVLFIPINEPQRNGVVECFNNIFDKKFLRSQTFKNLEHLKDEAAFYQDYYCDKRPHSSLHVKTHGSKVPSEVHFMSKPRLLPYNFNINDFKHKGKIKIPLTNGKVSFIRFINKNCYLDIFSERFLLDENLKYHYVKATILVGENLLQIQDNDEIIKEIPYYLKE